ncbi:hypothetical protein [Bradyrhizobium sp. HKCCYLR20261]|uniref:hypothetical protein n=1 Tax=Bradyrhizobium sp. HKCCYLR20261 TaxID=3420760 RepID=UPI003EBEFC86
MNYDLQQKIIQLIIVFICVRNHSLRSMLNLCFNQLYPCIGSRENAPVAVNAPRRETESKEAGCQGRVAETDRPKRAADQRGGGND